MAALIVDRDYHLDVVFEAGDIVVIAEAGSRMDTACAGVGGDIVGQNELRGLGQEGVVCHHELEEGTRMGLEDLVFVEAAYMHDPFSEGFGYYIDLPVRSLDERVVQIRVKGYGEVARKSPGRRSQDEEGELRLVYAGELSEVVVYRELDVYGRDRVVVVFNLSLGKSSLVLRAPVDGLEALVDMSVFVHLSEDSDLVGLKALIHGLVGVVPVSDDAEALEALALDVYVVVCKFLAGGAEVRRAHGFVIEFVLLYDRALDRHAVVVPAGDVRRVVAAHSVGAGDEVLEAFVQSVAHVDRAVGERRAVVQVEEGLALVLLEHLIVYVELLPGLEHLRLAFRKACSHRKVGLRQIQSGIVISWHSFISCIMHKEGVLLPALRMCKVCTGPYVLQGKGLGAVKRVLAEIVIGTGKVQIHFKLRSRLDLRDLLIYGPDAGVNISHGDGLGGGRNSGSGLLLLCNDALGYILYLLDLLFESLDLARAVLGVCSLCLLETAFQLDNFLIEAAEAGVGLGLGVRKDRSGFFLCLRFDLNCELLGRQNSAVYGFFIAAVLFDLIYEDLHLAL